MASSSNGSGPDGGSMESLLATLIKKTDENTRAMVDVLQVGFREATERLSALDARMDANAQSVMHVQGQMRELTAACELMRPAFRKMEEAGPSKQQLHHEQQQQQQPQQQPPQQQQQQPQQQQQQRQQQEEAAAAAVAAAPPPQEGLLKPIEPRERRLGEDYPLEPLYESIRAIESKLEDMSQKIEKLLDAPQGVVANPPRKKKSKSHSGRTKPGGACLVCNKLAEDWFKQEAEEKEKGMPAKKMTPDDFWGIMQNWMCSPNKSRVNVTPAGQTSVKSDILGIVRRRGVSQLKFSKKSTFYPAVLKAAARFLEDNPPPGMEGRKFPFSSLCINDGYAAKKHRDENNEGISAIRAFGDFSGGRVFVWPKDTGKRKDSLVEDLPEEEAEVRDVKGATVILEGKKAHMVEAFQGKRMSFVWYTVSGYDQISEATRADAQEKYGLSLPTKEAAEETWTFLGYENSIRSKFLRSLERNRIVKSMKRKFAAKDGPGRKKRSKKASRQPLDRKWMSGTFSRRSSCIQCELRAGKWFADELASEGERVMSKEDIEDILSCWRCDGKFKKDILGISRKLGKALLQASSKSVNFPNVTKALSRYMQDNPSLASADGSRASFTSIRLRETERLPEGPRALKKARGCVAEETLGHLRVEFYVHRHLKLLRKPARELVEKTFDFMLPPQAHEPRIELTETARADIISAANAKSRARAQLAVAEARGGAHSMSAARAAAAAAAAAVTAAVAADNPEGEGLQQQRGGSSSSSALPPPVCEGEEGGLPRASALASSSAAARPAAEAAVIDLDQSDSEASTVDEAPAKLRRTSRRTMATRIIRWARPTGFRWTAAGANGMDQANSAPRSASTQGEEQEFTQGIAPIGLGFTEDCD